MVLDDWRVKVREIAETIGISKDRVGYILHEELDRKKLCARWLPHLLTADQKYTRMKISEQCLEHCNKNKTDFVQRRFITMDETWIHHYTPESKQQSKQWTEPVVQRQRSQVRFHQQERSWHVCFGMLKAFCLLIILKRVKQ
jgi:histone-lysine N-methyltransferase SETMAR